MIARRVKGTKPVICDTCGSKNVEALLRQSVCLTRYETHRVVGVGEGKLILGVRRLERWEDNSETSEFTLDEELKCMDCGAFPAIENLSIEETDFQVGDIVRD